MMSKHPVFPLWVSDFIDGTSHLNAEETGVYCLLLMSMWSHGGSIPDDNQDNARICRVSLRKWIAIKKRLAPLLTFSEREITQKRLQREWNRIIEKSESQRQKGILSGIARAKKNKGLADNPVNKRLDGGSNQQNMNPVGTGDEPLDLDLDLKESPSSPEEEKTAQNSNPTNGSGDDRTVHQVITDMVWQKGIPDLVKLGAKESTIRSFIGKCLKTSDPEDVLRAIEAAVKLGTKEPQAYITKVLENGLQAGGDEVYMGQRIREV